MPTSALRKPSGFRFSLWMSGLINSSGFALRIRTPRVCTTLAVLTALPMPSSSSTSLAYGDMPDPKLSSCSTSRDLPRTSISIAPRTWSQSPPIPLPISKLPPLRPPSPSFQLLGAEISWSEISRSQVSPYTRVFRMAHSLATPKIATLPALQSSFPSAPRTDDRVRPVANPPIRDSPSLPAIATSRITHPHTAPTPATSLTSPLGSVPQPLHRGRLASSLSAVQRMSWLNPRSALLVYVVSICVGFAIVGMFSPTDRPDRSLTQIDCTEAILVDL